MKNEVTFDVVLKQIPLEGVVKEFKFTDLKVLDKLAEDIGVPQVYSAMALLKAKPYKEGLTVKGLVQAEIMQHCIVTLEPIASKISEPVEVTFLPDIEIEKFDENTMFSPEAIAKLLEEDDPPEPLIDGKVDLYEVIREFLALGINPYPRKEGVAFQDPNAGAIVTPFDILKKLK